MEVMEKYNKTNRIGQLPKEWKLHRLGDLLEFKNGLNKEKRFFGHGTPIINYMDVFSGGSLNKKIISGKVSVTNKEKRSFDAKVGDFFFTRTSETVEEIGMVSVLVEDIENAVFIGFVLRGRPTGPFFDLGYQKYCFQGSLISVCP